MESTVVQKIDRVLPADLKVGAGSVKTESAFECGLGRRVGYSPQLHDIIAQVSSPIEKTVAVLNSIKPFRNKLHLIIREDVPLIYAIEKNRITIGSAFLASGTGHLSRGIIKSWINENKGDFSFDAQLFEESLTDLVLYVITGKVVLENPVDKSRTKLGTAKWPQVIKTPHGYCQSAWKYAEDELGCATDESLDDFSVSTNSAVKTLRPLLTSALVASFEEMAWSGKALFITRLAAVLENLHLPVEHRLNSILADANPLHAGLTHVKKFLALWSPSTRDFPETLSFQSLLNQNLQNNGVVDAIAEAYFDYVVELTEPAVPTSALYKKLMSAAYENPNVQVALKDPSNIWILPSRTPLPLLVFDRVRSRQSLLIGCHLDKKVRVDQFFKKAEKLMLINECDKKIAYDFDSLLRSGVKTFIARNGQVNFVQLHIPSFEMVQNDLNPAQNFFDLIKNHDVTRQEFKTLGWSQVHWTKELKAYRPEAAIDAIEYFRN